MRVLITGASGMLGKDVVDMYSKVDGCELYVIYRNKEVKLPYSNITTINFDITDLETLKNYTREINPDIIVHCAALVNVDECENNRAYVTLFHSEATKCLAENAPNASLVYISSDSVFDGEKGNYSETDIPNPVNFYSQTKYEGEKNALRYNSNAIIIRTNIYGFHHTKMASLVEFGLENLQAKKQFGGFTDVYFNPLYTKQLSEIILKLTETKFKGIINAASDTFISKYSFLVELAKVFNCDTDLVLPKSVSTVNFKARRPLNTSLNISLLRNTFNISPNLSDGLKHLCMDYALVRGHQ